MFDRICRFKNTEIIVFLSLYLTFVVDIDVNNIPADLIEMAPASSRRNT